MGYQAMLIVVALTVASLAGVAIIDTDEIDAADGPVTVLGYGYYADATDAQDRINELRGDSPDITDVAPSTMYIVYEQSGFVETDTITGEIYNGGRMVFSETLSNKDGVRTWYFSDSDEGGQVKNVDFTSGETFDIRIYNGKVLLTQVAVKIGSLNVQFEIDGVQKELFIPHDEDRMIALPNITAFTDITLPTGTGLVGWQLVGTDEVIGSGEMVGYEDGKFVAKISKFFDVTFEGGTAVKYFEGDSVSLPKDPKQTGMIFVGWKEEGTEAVIDFSTYEVSKTVKFVPVFSKDHVIEFVTDTDVIFKRINYSDVIGKFDPEILLHDPLMDNHTFTGWFDGETEFVTKEVGNGLMLDMEITGDMEFVATFTPNPMKVTFIAGESKQTIEVPYGSAITEIPEVPSGYDGWDFDFETVILEDSQIVAIPTDTSLGSTLGTIAIVLVIVILVLFVAYLFNIFGFRGIVMSLMGRIGTNRGNYR